MGFSRHFTGLNETRMLLIRGIAAILGGLICYLLNKKLIAFGFAVVGSTLITVGMQMIIMKESMMDLDDEYPLKEPSKDSYTYLCMNIILFLFGMYVQLNTKDEKTQQ